MKPSFTIAVVVKPENESLYARVFGETPATVYKCGCGRWNHTGCASPPQPRARALVLYTTAGVVATGRERLLRLAGIAVLDQEGIDRPIRMVCATGGSGVMVADTVNSVVGARLLVGIEGNPVPPHAEADAYDAWALGVFARRFDLVDDLLLISEEVS